MQNSNSQNSNSFYSNQFQTENRFTIQDEVEFTSCFRERDKKKLIVPSGLKFPMRIRSYFTWQEPSGTYTYLIFKKPNWDMPKGMALKKISLSGEPSGRMCSWCNSYGSSDEIGMLSVSVNSNVSFSYIICSDLRCIEKIEDFAAQGGKSSERYIDLLYQKIGHFFENVANYKQD